MRYSYIWDILPVKFYDDLFLTFINYSIRNVEIINPLANNLRSVVFWRSICKFSRYTIRTYYIVLVCFLFRRFSHTLLSRRCFSKTTRRDATHRLRFWGINYSRRRWKGAALFSSRPPAQFRSLAPPRKLDATTMQAPWSSQSISPFFLPRIFTRPLLELDSSKCSLSENDVDYVISKYMTLNATAFDRYIYLYFDLSTLLHCLVII